MADNLTKAQRSELMSRVRRDNTGPELAFKRILAKLGIDYAYQPRHVLGHPDFEVHVPGKRTAAVFVHGCFWHGCPQHGRIPKTRTAHWRQHIAKNKARHRRNARKLREQGYRVLVIWEHDLPRKKTRRLTK